MCFKNRMACTFWLSDGMSVQFYTYLTCHEGVISNCLPETVSLNQLFSTLKMVHCPLKKKKKLTLYKTSFLLLLDHIHLHFTMHSCVV